MANMVIIWSIVIKQSTKPHSCFSWSPKQILLSIQKMWGHFFPRTLLFCYNFFAKVISEDIWGSPAKKFWGWKPPKPPKTAKSLKTTKKGSEHASLDILKALILIIFSHFFQVGAVHTTPKNHFFAKRFFPWIFSLTHLSNEPKWLVRLADFKNSWYLEQSVISLISKYIRVGESYCCNCCESCVRSTPGKGPKIVQSRRFRTL